MRKRLAGPRPPIDPPWKSLIWRSVAHGGRSEHESLPLRTGLVPSFHTASTLVVVRNGSLQASLQRGVPASEFGVGDPLESCESSLLGRNPLRALLPSGPDPSPVTHGQSSHLSCLIPWVGSRLSASDDTQSAFWPIQAPATHGVEFQGPPNCHRQFALNPIVPADRAPLAFFEMGGRRQLEGDPGAPIGVVRGSRG